MPKRWRVEAEFVPEEGDCEDTWEGVTLYLQSKGLDDVEIEELGPAPEPDRSERQLKPKRDVQWKCENPYHATDECTPTSHKGKGQS